eukprot:GHRQ01020620.1.p1 GENE.GHRQ01020620.1~~GHRQ01020620.1.p1  ORF type:complete len:194 (-),score=35.41 GHRQ01020620.1:592-1173(-)
MRGECAPAELMRSCHTMVTEACVLAVPAVHCGLLNCCTTPASSSSCMLSLVTTNFLSCCVDVAASQQQPHLHGVQCPALAPATFFIHTSAPTKPRVACASRFSSEARCHSCSAAGLAVSSARFSEGTRHHRCLLQSTLPSAVTAYQLNAGFMLVLQQEVRRSLISATAATSLMACFLMGAIANLPLAVAPGMG